MVALRKESVDRNIDVVQIMFNNRTVALRKESVDRNRQKLAEAIKPSVALRKESVDRNDNTPIRAYNIIKSLSARRAWIEIVYCQAMQENF